MKNNLLMVAIVISMLSCSKDENVNPSNDLSQSSKSRIAATATTIEPLAVNLVPIITSGTWYVSSYASPTENKTKNFSKLTLTCTANLYGGGVSLNDGGKLSSGNWTSQGIVYYGVPTTESLREWSFSLGKDYKMLSKSWLIREITPTSVTFDSANPAEGITMILSQK
jgi:hypothetical protein